MKILQFVSVPEDESVAKPITAGPVATTTTTVSKSTFFLSSFHHFSNL